MCRLANAIYECFERFSTIAPSLILIVGIVALAIAWRQSREASRARRLTATKLLLDEIGNDDVREARHAVLNRMVDFTVEDIRSQKIAVESMQAVRRVGVAYDRVGIMIKQSLLDESILFDSQRVEIQEIWNKIKPFVLYVRTDLKRENYLIHFEYLAERWLSKMRHTSRWWPGARRMG